MGFWKDIKQAIKEGVKEGIEEGRAEGEAESAAVEEKFAAKDEAKRAAAEAEMRRTLDERVAFIPYEEKFALCLAAPFRITLFYDWYTVWKDDDWESRELYHCPLHLYTFGDGVDVTKKDIKNITEYIRRDLGIRDRESAVRAVRGMLRAAGISTADELFGPGAKGKNPSEDYSVFADLLENAEDDMQSDMRTPIAMLLCAMIALALTAGAEACYITKDEAMETLRDVNRFVRGQFAEGEGWPDYARAFLQGESYAELNKPKGRKLLHQFVGCLLDRPGSPWNNVPFRPDGEEDVTGEDTDDRDGDSGSLLYEEEEIDILEAHIEKYFGNFPKVFHEIVSPDLHMDVALIPPSAGRFRKILVTMGAGAYRMDIPEALKDKNLERMELVAVLPPNWATDSKADADYWPIGTTKAMGRYPLNNDTWLGWGHSVEFGEDEPFPGTDYMGYVLDIPRGFPEGAEVCPLPDGTEINFYQLIPVYASEMVYKREKGMEALLERFAEAFGDDWDGMTEAKRHTVA
jgi:hypothetical protein